VLREAATLRELGSEVLVAGVVSTEERERTLDLDGTRVVRLDPLAALKGAFGRRRVRAASAPGPAGGVETAAPADAPAAEPAAPPAAGIRTRLRRLTVTGAYYLQGARLAWRTSPALVHANDYNTMWIAIAAKLLRGSSVVYDCHELWADRNGRPEWRPWLVACEALFVRVADATITTSPGYADAIARRYRVPRPTVVRNIPARRRMQAHEEPPRDQPVVMYVGGLMPGRGLEQSIRALTRAPELRLRLLGPGGERYRASLQRCAEQAGVAGRVELRAAVPPGELLDAIAGADVGLMLIEPVCRSYELTLPNKLFEYAAAGVPILASDLPVIGAVVRSEAIGEVVHVDDARKIGQAMRALAEPARNRSVRERVRAFAARETWERERAVLADVYRRLGPASPGERGRVQRAYDRYAGSARKQRSWAAENPGNVAIRRELVGAALALAKPALADAADSREILDVGCGSGWWLAELAARPELGTELHGLDVLPDRVQAARRRVPGAAIEVGDARALPYGDGRFGVVTLFTVLSSLANARGASLALREARRVLAPGGVLLIWEPRFPNPLNRGTLLITRRLAQAALAGLQLTVREITLLPPLARRLGPRTETLYPRLARIAPLRSHRLIGARANPTRS
jgi:glycosyltransferase involved in cell wall biosynthesis/SAM-dependent methyltransferase